MNILKVALDHKKLAASACLFIYLAIVRYLRFRNIRYIRKKYPDPNTLLNDSKAANEVFSILFKKEFPFACQKSLEFGFFKTYTIPTISKTLCGTSEFEKSCPRRVDDTDFMLKEVVEQYGRIQKQLQKNPQTPQVDIDQQSKRADLAIKRLNELHGKYRISNGDYLYTLALFTSEPLNWINLYEWRKLDIREYNALFRVWYDVGVKMNIQDIPKTPDDMLTFKKEYAEKYLCYSPKNWECGEPTFRFLLSQLPRFLQKPAYQAGLHVLPSLLDREDAQAFQLPEEKKWITCLVRLAFNVRAFTIRYFCLPRSEWLIRTPFYPNDKGYYVPEYNDFPPVYPNGYKIEELGPERYMPKTCPFVK